MSSGGATIPRVHTPEVAEAILGSFEREGETYSRTMLHVPSGSDPNALHVERLSFTNVQDPEVFNAIGFLAVRGPEEQLFDASQEIFHAPLLNVDGGALIQAVPGNRSKVILCADPHYPGTYTPRNLLKDVLHNYGIEAEILEYQDGDSTKVHTVTLRSDEPQVFQVAESSTEGHSHVFIQRLFSDEHHRMLLRALREVGAINPLWHRLAVTERMGILRTPWVDKFSIGE